MPRMREASMLSLSCPTMHRQSRRPQSRDLGVPLSRNANPHWKIGSDRYCVFPYLSMFHWLCHGICLSLCFPFVALTHACLFVSDSSFSIYLSLSPSVLQDIQSFAYLVRPPFFFYSCHSVFFLYLGNALPLKSVLRLVVPSFHPLTISM